MFAETKDMDFRFVRNQGPREQQKPMLVSYRGRVRYDGDGTRWRTEYDSMMPPSYGSTRLTLDQWTTGFDGARRYRWVADRFLFLGESSPEARRWSPRSIIWEKSDQLVWMLERTDRGRPSIAMAKRVIDGMRCYVVTSRTPDGRRGGETIISPRQGYLPIERNSTDRGRTDFSRRLRGVHEVVPGIWAPKRIEEETFTVRDDRASRFRVRRRIQVVEYRPRQVPPAAAFQVEIPYGVDLIDRSTGTSYHNDPWWPEIGAMLREKFDWPPPDFSPLVSLRSDSERHLDGRPAPPLRIATWLNTRPMDLAAHPGKVVLVEFGDIPDRDERRYAPALRELYSLYHPAGLEIISIHPPTGDADEIRRFAREYRLPYPVVIDEGPPGSAGKTAEAFGIQDRICAFLIDHEGKVHAAGEPSGGGIVGTLVSLLKRSGAREIKAVSLERPELPVEASRAAEALFQARVKEALAGHPQGRIRGRIVDGDGRPIAGASVEASIRLLVMQSTEPDAWRNIRYRAADDRLEGPVRTRWPIRALGTLQGRVCPDGRVARPGLGGAPGLPRARPATSLGRDRPGSGGCDLGTGPRPAGPAGRAAGSCPPGGNTSRAGSSGITQSVGHLALTADEDGRFRLEGLQHGRYIIEVKAGGFKGRELEPIPAGDENVVVTLERGP